MRAAGDAVGPSTSAAVSINHDGDLWAVVANLIEAMEATEDAGRWLEEDLFEPF